MSPKYPHIEVELVGAGGNAFAILGLVKRALKQAGVPKAEIDAFFDGSVPEPQHWLDRLPMTRAAFAFIHHIAAST